MKRIYSEAFGCCSAALVKITDEEWEIQSVNTKRENRGKGHARVLMKRILADADREGIVLLLTAGIGRESGLSTEELVEWYCRLGFDAIAPGSFPGTTLMQRVPRMG